MKNLNKKFNKFIFLLLILFSFEANSKIVSIGSPDSKVTIKVFSSLTCPACANFHSKIFYQLKKDYIDKGLVKFEHHPFPLDLAALNAEIILRCNVDNNKKFELLGKIYDKQRLWAVGSDIKKINDLIKKIGSEVNLKVDDMDNCLNNDIKQDEILNHRIEAQKKYNIEATPTIFLNEKKYNGKVDYKEFKKAIEKNL
tara:strand:- start:371 stop:964 length:594 start_codon:yes stop_codon:yes gene_type:complete